MVIIVIIIFPTNSGFIATLLSVWQRWQARHMHTRIHTEARTCDSASRSFRLISSKNFVHSGAEISQETSAPATELNGLSASDNFFIFYFFYFSQYLVRLCSVVVRVEL